MLPIIFYLNVQLQQESTPQSLLARPQVLGELCIIDTLVSEIQSLLIPHKLTYQQSFLMKSQALLDNLSQLLKQSDPNQCQVFAAIAALRKNLRNSTLELHQRRSSMSQKHLQLSPRIYKVRALKFLKANLQNQLSCLGTQVIRVEGQSSQPNLADSYEIQIQKLHQLKRNSEESVAELQRKLNVLQKTKQDLQKRKNLYGPSLKERLSKLHQNLKQLKDQYKIDSQSGVAPQLQQPMSSVYRNIERSLQNSGFDLEAVTRGKQSVIKLSLVSLGMQETFQAFKSVNLQIIFQQMSKQTPLSFFVEQNRGLFCISVERRCKFLSSQLFDFLIMNQKGKKVILNPVTQQDRNINNRLKLYTWMQSVHTADALRLLPTLFKKIKERLLYHHHLNAVVQSLSNNSLSASKGYCVTASLQQLSQLQEPNCEQLQEGARIFKINLTFKTFSIEVQLTIPREYPQMPSKFTLRPALSLASQRPPLPPQLRPYLRFSQPVLQSRRVGESDLLKLQRQVNQWGRGWLRLVQQIGLLTSSLNSFEKS